MVLVDKVCELFCENLVDAPFEEMWIGNENIAKYLKAAEEDEPYRCANKPKCNVSMDNLREKLSVEPRKKINSVDDISAELERVNDIKEALVKVANTPVISQSKFFSLGPGMWLKKTAKDLEDKLNTLGAIRESCVSQIEKFGEKSIDWEKMNQNKFTELCIKTSAQNANRGQINQVRGRTKRNSVVKPSDDLIRYIRENSAYDALTKCLTDTASLRQKVKDISDDQVSKNDLQGNPTAITYKSRYEMEILEFEECLSECKIEIERVVSKLKRIRDMQNQKNDEVSRSFKPYRWDISTEFLKKLK